MAELTPYSYKAHSSPIHDLGAGVKLAALCALSLTAFFTGIPGLVFSSAAVIAAAFAARLAVPSLFYGSKSLAIATFLVILLRTIEADQSAVFFIRMNVQGLYEGLVFAWGVFVSFAAGSVLFATTTTAELRFALSRAERICKKALTFALPSPAAKRLHSVDLSLTIALALAFIPRVFSVWEAAEDAHAARCGKKGVRGIATLIPLAAERLIEAAAETASAMESRGYERGLD